MYSLELHRWPPKELKMKMMKNIALVKWLGIDEVGDLLFLPRFSELPDLISFAKSTWFKSNFNKKKTVRKH